MGPDATLLIVQQRFGAFFVFVCAVTRRSISNEEGTGSSIFLHFVACLSDLSDFKY